MQQNSRGPADPLDIIPLASKLARASYAEPYWKSRTKPAAESSSESARLRKQLATVHKDFSALLALHEKTDASLQDVQGKIRQLRAEAASKDKALDLCRRTIDRLTAEKSEQEGNTAADKAYIRRLESRLLSVKNAVELQAACAEYKAQAEQLAQQLRLAEARSAAAENEQGRQQQEAAFLKRGIELAAEQLTRSAGADVPATLLMAVARAQEEGMEMSAQLADCRQQLAQMASALQHARAHLLEQQKLLEELQREGGQSSAALAEAQAALEAERVAAGELRHIVASLRQQVEGLREERDGLRHQVELDRSAAAAAEEKVGELEAACRRQAKTEATLRTELRQLQDTVQQSQQAQQQPTQPEQVQHGPAAPHAAPAVRRPAAPTPARGGGRARQAVQLRAGARAVLEGPSPIQRLRQQRVQQQRQLGHSPSPEAEVFGQAPPAQQTLFHVQEQHQGHQGLGLVSLGLDSPSLDTNLRRPAEPRPVGRAAGAAQPGKAAAAVPPAEQGGGRLAGLYSSTLDEQIAALEGDLAELSASCSPTKLLQLLHRGPAAAGHGGMQQHQAGREGPAPPPQRPVRHSAPQQQEQQQQRAPAHPARPGVSMGPADPLSLSQASHQEPAPAAGAAAVGKQQLGSPAGKLSPQKLLEPSPSKLRPQRGGWPAASGAAGSSAPPSPQIAAWRPNGAYEPAMAPQEDIVLFRASMPEQPALGLGAWEPAATMAAAAAARAAPESQPGAATEGNGEAAYDLPPPEQQPPAGQQPVQGKAASRRPLQQGLVWHSNPLASSPSPETRPPARQSTPQPQLAAAAAAAVLGDLGGAGQPQEGPEGSGRQASSAGPASSATNSSATLRPQQEEAEEPQARSPAPGPQRQERQQSREADSRWPEPGAPLPAEEGSWEWQRGPTPPHPPRWQQQGRPQQAAAAAPLPHMPPPSPQEMQRGGGNEGWWEDEFATLMTSEHAQQAQQARRQQQQQQQAPSQGPQHHKPPQQQRQGTAASRDSGSGSLLRAFSRGQWSAPSGASSWLNTAYEPDIEQLEVNSSRKPAAPAVPAPAAAAGRGEAAAAGTQQQQQPHVGPGPAAEPGGEPSLATLFELATLDMDFL